MRRFLVLFSLVGGALGLSGAETANGISFEHQVTPLLEKYCYDCHGDGAHKGGVSLDEFTSAASVHQDRKTWETVLHHVRSREMPPDDGGLLPNDAERDVIGGWIEKELYNFDAAHPDPGRVVLRRLNRAEYNATVRDLVGVDFKPAADFPPDDSGYGFDNVGDVLSLPPVLLEKYLNAADKVLDQAIVTDPIKSEVRHIPASVAEIGFNAIGDRGDGWVHLISLEEDDVAVPLSLPAGDYLVRILAYATKTGGALKGQGSEKPIEFTGDPGPTKIALSLNDAFVKDFIVTTDEAHPEVYEARMGVPAGRQYFRASMRRKRGGSENELFMLNGRIGQQQPGIVFVKWMEIEGPLPAATRRYKPTALEVTGEGKFTAAGERVLNHEGEVAVNIDVPREAEMRLRVQAYAQQAGDQTARMEFRVDGKAVQTFEVLAPATMIPIPKQRPFSPALLVPYPQVYEVSTKLPAGRHRFAAAFVNDFADPENPNPNLRDRNLIIQNLEVANLGEPIVPPSLPEPLQQLFTQAPERASPASQTKAARAILAPFARRAWRRPVEPAELDRLMKLYAMAREQGDSFEAGVKLGMKAVMVSPHFLFIGETHTASPTPSLGPDLASVPRAASLPGTDARSGPTFDRTATGPRPIDEFALASRLSYFLWSSMPDDALLDLAERGKLRASLPAQVRRMLADPKSRALVDNFAGQWLQIRSLETFQPDKKLFPEYDAALRTSMQRETELFFEYVMREDRSVFDFLTGDYTFVNSRLAKLYGLPEVNGDDFQKVSLAGTPRRGVLTQASVLTLTSNPTRTSPVKRGKWVLENILGTPPPPPPPTVPSLDDGSRQLVGTLRQQMEQHRANPSCASCHARMDPIGFSLENFNAIGGWRDKDGESTIDASGKFGSGDSFSGAAQLADVLAKKRRDEFLRCVAEKMLIYALGRGTEYYDRPAIERIVKSLDQNQGRFSSLVLAVAESFPFQMRRGDAPENPTLADAR
jgi:hypothetical protein